MPGNIGRRPGRGRVATGELMQVGAVDPGGPHADEHLAVAGLGIGALLDDDLAVCDGRGVHRDEGYPGAALEQRHALDVRRLREHVHRPDRGQPPARLDELGRVRGERRGVARHVDDARGGRFDQAAHDLRREARAGRVDDEHVGPAGATSQLAQREPGVAGEEVRVGYLVAARVGDRVGDRLRDDLQPPQLAGPPRERQSDRADPAVEVVQPFPALQVGELGDDAVEDLGHLGVRLEERLGRDAQVEIT